MQFRMEELSHFCSMNMLYREEIEKKFGVSLEKLNSKPKISFN